MFEVGSAVARVKADVSNFKSGMQEARDEANGLGSTMSKIGGGVVDFAKQAAIFTGVVAGGLALVGKVGVESAAKFEQYQIAFTTLLKDEKKAMEAIKNIQEDAAKTPFELAPLVMANQRLISAGISADKARKDILNLGDAISATGGGGAELERLSTNLQQIKAVGKASALDIKQFAFAGINVYQMLADATGKNVEEVRNMDVSYEMLSKAFEKASGKGGMFENAMVKQSKSLNGLISTLKDTVSLGLKDILMNSGLFEAIRSTVGNVIPMIESAVPKIVRFFEVIAGGIDLLRGVMSGENLMAEVQEFISYFTGGEIPDENHPAVRFFYFLADGLKTIGNWISENQELVLTFLKGLAIAVGALLILGTITTLIMAFTNPLVIAIGLIALLYTAWQTNFWGIRDITTQIFNEVKALWDNILYPLITFIAQYITDRWTYIQEMTQGTWNIIRGIIEVVWGVIYGIFSVGLALLTGDWEKAWQNMLHAGETIWDGIKKIFNGALEFIAGWGGKLVSDLTKPFEDAWHSIEGTVNKIKDALDFTKRHSPSVVDIVQKGVGLVNKAFEELPMGDVNIPAHIMPSSIGAGISSGGSSPMYMNVQVSLDGAFIGDESSARRMSEIVGNNIIKKLQLNVRV